MNNQFWTVILYLVVVGLLVIGIGWLGYFFVDMMKSKSKEGRFIISFSLVLIWILLSYLLYAAELATSTATWL